MRAFSQIVLIRRGKPREWRVHGRNGLLREQCVSLGACSRNLQSPFDVSLGLITIQRIKSRAKSNPLLELSEPDGVQFLLKFRLADQYDLQQLVSRPLQVRQKTDLFKYFRGQMVGFVHDEYGSQLFRSSRTRN